MWVRNYIEENLRFARNSSLRYSVVCRLDNVCWLFLQHSLLFRPFVAAFYRGGVAAWFELGHVVSAIYYYVFNLDLEPSCIGWPDRYEHGTISWSTLNFINEFIIVGVYASPKVPSTELDTFISQLNENTVGIRTILIGDFNTKHELVAKILEPLKNLVIKSDISKVTTLGGTTIDLVLSNTEVTCGVYLSMTSYHEPVWCWIASGKEW